MGFAEDAIDFPRAPIVERPAHHLADLDELGADGARPHSATVTPWSSTQRTAKARTLLP